MCICVCVRMCDTRVHIHNKMRDARCFASALSKQECVCVCTCACCMLRKSFLCSGCTLACAQTTCMSTKNTNNLHAYMCTKKPACVPNNLNVYQAHIFIQRDVHLSRVHFTVFGEQGHAHTHTRKNNAAKGHTCKCNAGRESLELLQTKSSPGGMGAFKPATRKLGYEGGGP